jgi:tetratricopeptide (TPR) repeat protein
MIVKKIYISFLVCIAFQTLNAQVTLDIIRSEYENFRYDHVIDLCQQALENRNALPKDDVIEIYLMQGLACYSLQELDKAANSFQDMLQIDPDYELNPILTSPKIIQFFEQVKSSLPPAASPVEVKSVRIDTVKIYLDPHPRFRGAVLRSLVLPGWGHYYQDGSLKGKIISCASIIASAASIYYSFDCSHKEKEYLSAADLATIEAKYQRYNSSFRMRNICLFSFAALWLYSQMDLLIFNQDNKLSDHTTGIFPVIDGQNYKISLRIPLSAMQ